MNQALTFGLLAGGGILFTKALTGNSWSQILQGHAGTVPTSSPLAAAAAGGVAGVGSTVAGVAQRLSSRGYTNPIPGATIGRTDQGVDADLAPGKPIVAIGLSKVIGIQQNWYQNQPFVWLQLLDGPQAGRYYYVAEQIAPTVKPGDVVAAGEQIGTYAPTGTGLELGWATKAGQTLARATSGYSEGQATKAGQSFHDFLAGLL